MSFSIDGIVSGVTGFVKDAAGRASNVLDPSGARLSIAGLLAGGRRSTQKIPETRVGFSVGDPKGNPVKLEDDWRVRIGVAPSSQLFYQGEDAGILAPLRTTMGVVFPYTPSITTSYSASYGQLKTTHSNHPAYYYESSEVQAIQISGDFTVQNQQEGQYLLACIYFFRSCTKMFYGSGNNAGNPPPVVFLNGYGSYLLPNVPCVVTSFQHVLPQEVDYIEIPSIDPGPGLAVNPETGETYAPNGTSASLGKGPTVRLPAASQLQIGLQPVYSRKRLAEFDLEKFAAGKLIDKGFM